MKSLQTLALTLATAALLLPTSALAQTSGVQTWSQRCQMCHRQQPANRYTAEKWESILTHMELTARLTSEQADAVLEFLKSGARKVAAQEAKDAAGLAVASSDGLLVEPPELASDFTDLEGARSRVVQEVARLIAPGEGGMPAFAASLSTEQLESVAEYIRTF